MNAVGQSMKRKEDPRMITGRGRYTEDINLPGMLHAVLVRSPEAHASIASIDTAAATEHAGVVAVLTAEDMSGDFAGGMAMVWAPPGVEIKTPENWPLKKGQVKHVGDPVAVVVAASKGAALDAADEVIVEYDPKPVVVDPELALEDGSPLVWEEFGTNKTHEWAVSGGDMEAALADAEVTIEHRFSNHRTSGAPIEPRCSIAEPRADSLILYSTTQVAPHRPLRAVGRSRDGGGQAARDRARRPRPSATERSPAAGPASSPTWAPTSCCSPRSSPSWASRWRAAAIASPPSTCTSPECSPTRCAPMPSAAPGGRR